MKDNAVYLEADEDITSAIDKLSKSTGDAVQIVVPKRSGLLQSIINLKLLKKAAEQSGKELVLVTNDRIAGDLASRVGLAVAPSLGAKAVINEAAIPEQLKSHEEVIEADDPEPPAPAPVVTPKSKAPRRPFLKSREVSDGPPAPVAPVMPAAGAASAAAMDSAEAAESNPKSGGPKVPNFKRLQHRLMWAGLAAFLIFGYMLTMFLITSAKVTLYANGTRVDIDTTFSVDPGLKTTDKAKAVLAGQTVSVSKDLSGSFTPTGKKDVGTKSSGQVTLYNEYDMSPHTLVSGTQLVAPDGKVFRTRAEVIVPGATVGLVGGKITLSPGKSDPVQVEADQNGDSYNEGPGKYTVKNYTGDMQTKIYGQGAQMSGGTSKTVSVVSASDVDTAKAALTEKDKDNATRDLAGRVPSGYVPLTASQSSSVESATSSPTVDAEGSSGTLVLKITYSVLAVKESEYKDLVRAQELKQIGDTNQIYDDGLKDAQVTVTEKDDSGRRSFHLTTEAYGGAKLDIPAITEKLKGQRYGDAAGIASRLPGVNRAEVSITPGWATSLPKRTDKIHITIQVAGQK